MRELRSELDFCWSGIIGEYGGRMDWFFSLNERVRCSGREKHDAR